MSKFINVDIQFDIPDNVTEEEFEEWFRYQIIDFGGCSGDNPLLDKDVNNLVSTYHIWG